MHKKSATKNREKEVSVVLGTMTFGGQTDEETSLQMVQEFLARGHRELDTAFLYQKGHTEEILGRILAKERQERGDSGIAPYVATKVNPWGYSGRSLKPADVKKQFTTSLQRLQVGSVDLLYLHGPDFKNPIEQTLEAVNELHQAGQIKEFGVSNFTAWQVVEIYHICKANGWVLPTVYQGMYNAITRDVEKELFPALRRYKIRFYAFNPLAGGMLTGKHRAIASVPTDGRFAEMSYYKDRYWKESYFAALDQISEACEAEGITMTEASLRWIMQHSQLNGDEGDAVIIGASKLEHFHQNIEYCEKKGEAAQLPKALLDAFDKAWSLTKADCPLYFRTN